MSNALPPPSSSGLVRTLSDETDFWAELFLELTVRIEWLGQILDAVPKDDTSASALVRMRSYTQALAELRHALKRVHAHRSEDHLKPLFALDGPLAAYLSRLYAWCEEIGQDFERMADALRRQQPTSIVFAHQAVNKSYAHFEKLITAVRNVNLASREHSDAKELLAWRAFDEHLEESIWAAEWVHMALARQPGE
jgi:alpha-L-fucosidase